MGFYTSFIGKCCVNLQSQVKSEQCHGYRGYNYGFRWLTRQSIPRFYFHPCKYVCSLHVQTRHRRNIPLDHLLRRLHLLVQLRVADDARRILDLAARLV